MDLDSARALWQGNSIMPHPTMTPKGHRARTASVDGNQLLIHGLSLPCPEIIKLCPAPYFQGK